jgi:pseudouridine-5'-phosphate glycosidase
MTADVLRLEEEVREARRDGRPLVALETSVLSHGLPRDAAFRAGAEMGEAVRKRDAVPAWTWVGGGGLHVGATDEELEALMDGRPSKVARRDLSMVVAGGGLGGTTVSATVWAARKAGIEVAATGGIGGVHPGRSDISADLLELARTPIALVCSGPKSILDPEATLERLEELGVPVVGYRCDRLPFFLVRETGLRLEHRAESPTQVAGIMNTHRSLDVRSAVVVANPVPDDAALSDDEVRAAVDACRHRAEAEGIRGSALTPYLLRCLGERTGGAALEANLALLASNAAVAADIAAELRS